jgi:hypothetical protein
METASRFYGPVDRKLAQITCSVLPDQTPFPIPDPAGEEIMVILAHFAIAPGVLW